MDHTPDASGVAKAFVLVTLHNSGAIGFLVQPAEAETGRAMSRRCPSTGLLSVEVACTSFNPTSVAVLWIQCEGLYDTAYRVSPVECTAGPPDDFHALDQISRKILPGRATAGGRTKAHTIHQKDRGIIRGAAGEYTGVLTIGTVGDQINARLRRQQICEFGRRLTTDGFFFNDRHRRQAFAHRAGAKRGSYNNRLESIQVGFRL